MFKMKKHERTRFSMLQKRAQQLNRTHQHRFQMIYQQHEKFTTVGLYDCKTKRYMISRDFELDFTPLLDEIEALLDSVGTRAVYVS